MFYVALGCQTVPVFGLLQKYPVCLDGTIIIKMLP